MVLLTLLAAQVTGAGRAETRVAAALRSAAQLRQAADAAVYETIWHMLDGGGDYWAPGSGQRLLDEAGSRVLVTIEDQRGKLDVNQVPPALLQALFAILGADNTTAATAAKAISEWHTQQPGDDEGSTTSDYAGEGRLWGPPGQDFQTLSELKLVRGMTPALYDASLPYLTLALEQGPWLAYAGPVVTAAVAKAKHDGNLVIEPADQRGPVVLRITAQASGPNHEAFERHVLMRLDGALSGPAWKYRILEWD
jgi:general secretion pathway protein K